MLDVIEKNLLDNYLAKVSQEERSSAVIAYLAALDYLGQHHPKIQKKIIDELRDQRMHLKLIASENYSSLAVQLAMGNLLTDKYAEGVPHRRFYAGCENVDEIEDLAVAELKALFRADHAYVQPHSGADANLVALWAILMLRVQNREMGVLGKKSLDELTPAEYEKIRQQIVNQKLMGMSLNSGGHLTHGYIHNVSAKMFKVVPYEVDRGSCLLDYLALEEQVKREKPLILLAGYSAYSRLINFAKMREIADSVGAILMVDMAHFAGLVAGKAFQGDFDPVPFAHIVTSTTHKTLRGPRGGIILCQKELKEVVDKGCPLVLGGPLPHVIAAKAIAFKEARTQGFQKYAHQIIANAHALARQIMDRGGKVVTNGTDNHLLLIDVKTSFGLTGRQAEMALRMAGLTVNRNAIPFDSESPWHGSGIRVGTPALTSRHMREPEMRKVADMIYDLLKATKTKADEAGNTRAQVEIDPKQLKCTREAVADLLQQFPLYPELLID